MNLLREKQRLSPCGGRLYKGGGSNSTESNPVTTNRDNRVANNGGAGVSGDGNTTVVEAADAETLRTLAAGQSDAVKFLTSAGAQMVKDSQSAIVDLNATSTAANRDMWDATITAGAGLVDKLIDQSTALGTAAIGSFTPTENKNADIGKYAMWAAGAVAAAVLLKGSK